MRWKKCIFALVFVPKCMTYKYRSLDVAINGMAINGMLKTKMRKLYALFVENNENTKYTKYTHANVLVIWYSIWNILAKRRSLTHSIILNRF